MKDKNSIDRIIQVNDIRIGDNIRRVRERAGLKQVELVAKLQVAGLDISAFSYNRIEKGTQNPTVSCLLTLCALLHCDMNELFGMTVEKECCPSRSSPARL